MVGNIYDSIAIGSVQLQTAIMRTFVRRMTLSTMKTTITTTYLHIGIRIANVIIVGEVGDLIEVNG